MNRFKENVAAIEREVSEWPGVSMTVCYSGRHARARLSFAGKERSLVMSVSSSDRRAVLNSVCMARKLMREIGAEKK